MAAEPREPGILYGISSWTVSERAYRYIPATKQSRDTHIQPKDPAESPDIVADEVDFTSADGTIVPLSIIHRRDTAPNGSNPTILAAYGCYGDSASPYFEPTLVAWLERDGVCGCTRARRRRTGRGLAQGGPAPNEAAHDRRRRRRGGLLVGGAIVQHPELFGAALDRVGLSDLLRFETTQGGAQDFRAMLAVSPYNNIVPHTAYPAVLLETGINDPRVPSWQLAKMTARLQAATSSKKPIVLRVDYDAGHGIGSDRAQLAALRADEFTFLFWQLGDPKFQP
jgi:prolyl oligopeptidase